VSAYAREGRECRHNLNYWRFGDYLGIGAGAHGKLTDASSGAVLRTARVRQPGRYQDAAEPAARIEETRALSRDDLAFEFMLNALRLVDGFDETLFESRTGLPWVSVAGPVNEAVARGLLAAAGGRWRPTSLGRQFLNDLQGIFLAGAAGSLETDAGAGLARLSQIG
jgi:oxygen-independent coproporphyrinogen-3 oxidase